ncbi:MAG: ribonuclease J [Proteobacteria bacterium]|uniref:Ribonuclease J n=1 Tax=Candidatus Enterousia avistercoris TaxID=2840788 RepID=A0A9D9DD21_9PROT|nr:ribonuclease J [Candidatus Enterousia avistercoris]
MVKVREKKTLPDTVESGAQNMPAKIRGTNKHESDKNDEKLYFMALGGLEHVGQNMYVYKYKGKYLVVDCGMGFLEEEIGAGDVQYCDTTWLEKRKKDVVGFVITHGHEDHIGALKYVWPKFRKPIYCTRFPGEILAQTFRGVEIDFTPGKDIVIFDHHGATLKLDPFEVETFHVSHSVPEAQMLIIKTPAGKVLHTGDWTFNDDNPIEEPTDYARLREIGSDPKLLACMSDSTSVSRQEAQTTEIQVRETLTEIMKNAPGRVLVTGYSRSIARMKMFAEAARAAGRVAAIKERSNPNPVPYVGLPEFREMGMEFGYLGRDEVYLYNDIKDLPAEKQAIFLTGSQGEQYAMLTRLCRGHVKEMKLQPTDTVLFSAIIIPGREQDVSYLYNKLARLGIKTHTIFDTDHLHASGHAGRPEFERFYDMVHPQVSVPMHGDYINEMLNGKMAMERGGAKHMMVVHNGEMIALADGEAPYIAETIETGFVVMEGETERSTDDPVYKTRKKIATNGAIFVTLPVDKRGFLKGTPEVSSAGIFETDDTGFMKRQIQIEITKAIDGLTKTERKDRGNLIRAVQVAANKVVRASLGADKKPQYSVHFVQK